MKEKPLSFDAYSIGVVFSSVCSNFSLEETTIMLNQRHPTGISSKWSFSKEKTFHLRRA